MNNNDENDHVIKRQADAATAPSVCRFFYLFVCLVFVYLSENDEDDDVDKKMPIVDIVALRSRSGLKTSSPTKNYHLRITS